jgi:hypothetical protein
VASLLVLSPEAVAVFVPANLDLSKFPIHAIKTAMDFFTRIL